MPKFLIQETAIGGNVEAKTVRLGAGTGAANNITTLEAGKPVKLIAESRYGLCAAGDPIEGVIAAVESFTQDGYSIGSIVDEGYKAVVFDGLQATPGTGTIAVGDAVVTGTVVAKGTALTADMKVCKATNQPGAAVVCTDNTKPNVDIALAAVVGQVANAKFLWRVVSLGTAGTGAVGTAGIIERVTC